ncbi:MAG: tRNA (N(6)-L-threonylcarbamoyladenosine(37)-C(2))-methylthiotransferase MtaB [Salinivirgaceae bacterium]|jgi:threonylcarbamoyladenosine tRNA methylthiotransferase MtaB|nr:tRNA (N(6)-L-threonylcarbamoyladenosine(37)-C(2))-methylthiotransferase MtaB [Salinivirgaceae bacterium]
MGQKVAFTTLGCKLNFSETSGIAHQFEEAGYTRVEIDEGADVFVINTCTVTELANKKSRQAIKKLIKGNPSAKIVAVGCYSQLKPDEVAAIEGIDLVLGSENKFEVINQLQQIEAEGKTRVIVSDAGKEKTFTPSYSYGDRTRSFLKVQDGCDYYCSYCTIPYARGRSRNNSIVQTVAKAREVVEKGIKEIILTGVNIGDFGKASDENFFGLVKALAEVEGLERLRISSIEPNLLTDEILEFVAQSKVIVPHFHIPLQCGTDNLLRLMRRRYTTSLYKKRVEKIKSLMPDACIAADVIVGVPGETADEFEKACSFIDSIDISYLHVFTYSERENTMAVKMPNQVPLNERKSRSKIMHALGEKKQRIFQEQHLNSSRQVLFELQEMGGQMFGFTDNYIKVEIPYNKELVNTTANVLLETVTDDGNVLGKLNI